MHLVLADQVTDGRRGHQELERQDPTPTHFGNQHLRENTLQHEGELSPDLILLGRGEHVDDAVNGLGA